MPHLSLGEMCEVAAAVAFLASKDASFVNATDLKVREGVKKRGHFS